MGRLKPAALLLIAVAGCSTILPGEPPPLGITNGTTLVVTLVVNGRFVLEVRPGGPSQEVDTSQLPGLPWLVEARSSSGRVLTSMVVNPGSIVREQLRDGSSRIRGTLGRVDLSCGRLDIWAGVPAFGPPPGPGVPGDCEP